MRLLPLVLAAGLTAAGCGLDTNGLGEGDDSGPSPSEGAAPDVTLGNDDANGGNDVTVTSDTGPGGDDSGGDDVTTGSDAADGATDAGNDAGPGLDASKDAADAGVDTGAPDTGPADTGVDSCGSVEICNNGIDDNCDGKIDCADPECNAWTCTNGAVPSGWSIVEYVENARPTCSTGYGSSVDVVEGPTGAPATCTCGCNVANAGSCESGNFNVSVNGFVPGCSTTPVTSPANNGACSPATVNYTPPSGAKMQVNPVGYAGGSCTPDASATLPPVTFAGQGRFCRDTNGAGAGCSNGGSCAPAAQGNGFALCISIAGTVSCPPGFTQPPHVVSAGITDTRGCTACTCGGANATCGSATLTLFTASDCSDAGETVNADGKCNSFPGPGGGGAPTYVAYKYAADVQGESCPPSPVSPDGGVSLTTPHTICCQ